ncbi:MAG TPA: hypothetical protein VF090_00105 [Methyloceanibacter sp.]|jgi:hypothetical protein
MESPAGEPHAWVSLVMGLLPIATAVGGALWGLYAYFDNQREAQEAAARQAEHDGQSRLIEAQRPFLVKQLDLYFETAQIAGKLVSLDPASEEWRESERRYWALYWSELSMVEHPVVESAMTKFGKALEQFKAAPEANKTALKDECYELAHAIRSGIKEAWGVAAPPTSQA